MRRALYKTVILLTAIGIALPMYAQTPKKPFPQAVNFTGCIKPNAGQDAMNTAIKSLYDNYKASYLKTSPNGYYVESKGVGPNGGTAITVSEQHGYGMLIFALMAGYDSNAKTCYDGMFKFYKTHFSHDNTNCMSWCVQPGEDIKKDSASATDGDFDIAYSLLLAHEQWGSDGAINYLREAGKMILNGIRETNIHWGTNIIGLGDWDESRDSSRTSDWMAGHLRLFAGVTGITGFTEVADNIYNLYTLFSNAFSPSTGLVSDFTDSVIPKPLQYKGEANSIYYNFNACRVPWRFAVDYAHYQTTGAKTACTKMITWLKGATSNNPSNIAEGYKLDGTALAGGPNACFVGPFGAACIVDAAHQSYLNATWNVMTTTLGADVYQKSINLLSMLLISGNWWKPNGEPMPAPDTTGAIIDNFNNEYGDTPRMNRCGAAYGKAKFNDVTKGGGLWFIYGDGYGTGGGKSKILKDSGGVAVDTSQSGDLISGGILKAFLNTAYTGLPVADERYAGIGCLFMGSDSSVYWDLSKMTGLSIRLRGKTSTLVPADPGSGRIRVMLLTEDVVKCYPKPEDAYGFFGFNIMLKGKDQWQWITIDTAFLKTVDNTIAGWGEAGEGKLLKWAATGNKKVNGIVFEVLKGGENAHLEVDKIVINGGTYKTFFNFDEPVAGIALQSQSLQNKSLRITQNMNGRSVTIQYKPALTNANNISVFNVKGRRIAAIANQNSLTVDGLSSGVYFVHLFAGDRVAKTKFTVTQ